MTEKTLLVGTSFSAVPLFRSLEKYDLDITVCGNNPQDPCHQYVSNSHAINYACKEDLLALCQQEGFDYIVPSCNDYAYMSCTWVADQLGLPGFDHFDTAEILHNKHLFRQFTQAHTFPVPKAIEILKGQITDFSSLIFPLLVKPVDSFSGRGVTKVTHPADLDQAITHAFSESNSNSLVLEEFVQGDLCSHSCFIKDGQIVFEVMADEYCTVYPYQVDCSNIPASLTETTQRRISECISSLIEALSLQDGLLHTQLIVKGEHFWLIECMRRAPGDLYGTMVELSTSFNYWDMYVRPFINQTIDSSSSARQIRYIARHTLSSKNGRYFQSYSTTMSAKNLLFYPLKNSGHFIEPAPYDKAGIIFAEFDTQDLLFEITPTLASRFTFS